MNIIKYKNILIIVGIIIAAAIIISLKINRSSVPKADIATKTEKTSDENVPPVETKTGITISAVQEKTAKLPKLVDLGAGKCIPCKMMAPILEELKKEYEGVFDVMFIDVWENPDAGKKYGIEMIPTQIFYDAEGKELFRHEGFFPKADILLKWKEFGFDVKDEAIKASGEKE